jgi:hypothetical protein
MSIEERFSRVKSLLEEHNQALPTDDPSRIDADKFIHCIKATQCGTTELRLKKMRHENIAACFKALFNFTPDVMIKEIAAIFRGTEEADETEEKTDEKKGKPVSAKRASLMTPRELLERFDAGEPNSAVGKRLQELIGGRACIIFNDDKTIHVDESLKLFEWLKQGYEPLETHTVDGRPRTVYQIGQRPHQHADENPLFPCRKLYPDGTCDQTQQSWMSVPPEVRQLVRIAVSDTREINVKPPGGIDRARDIILLAIDNDAMVGLRKRYPKASVKFDELQELGTLPILKVSMRASNIKCRTGAFEGGEKVLDLCSGGRL